MLTSTDPQSPPQTTTLAYDVADQLTAITYSDGVTPNVSNITYDRDGQRTSMTDGTGTSLYTYDSLNRLVSSSDGAGNKVAYGYDLKGQITGITYPGISITTQRVVRSYDGAGRLHTVQDWLGNVTTFGYDRNSNLIYESFPPGTGLTDKFGYDAADRLMAISYKGVGTTLANLAYGRDPANLLSSVSSTGVLTTNETYRYTTLNQLRKVNSAPYGYDAADNIVRLTTGDSLQYDPANELTSLTSGSGITTTFTFDPRGDRTRTTPPAGPPINYTYDQASRLTAYGTLATYTYNGDGLRMSKTVGGVAEPFAWDVGRLAPATQGRRDSLYLRSRRATPRTDRRIGSSALLPPRPARQHAVAHRRIGSGRGRLHLRCVWEPYCPHGHG